MNNLQMFKKRKVMCKDAMYSFHNEFNTKSKIKILRRESELGQIINKIYLSKTEDGSVYLKYYIQELCQEIIYLMKEYRDTDFNEKPLMIYDRDPKEKANERAGTE